MDSISIQNEKRKREKERERKERPTAWRTGENEKVGNGRKRRPPMLKPVRIPRVLKSLRSIVIRGEIYGGAINSTIYGAIAVNK